MTTLEDAWRWYQRTSLHLRGMERLARRYWGELPWEDRLDRDEHFRNLQGDVVEAEVTFSLSFLGDLAIVVLFSVFESRVRARVIKEVAEESESLRHRALRAAAAEVREKIAEGSFFHVLEPFKDGHADLVEQVNQVRRYRNWVAHGRRGEPAANVTPELAYERLRQFLAALDEAPGTTEAGVAAGL